ncbi:hypothetical protein [Nocardiopsis alba]|uniref:hypothetical protein n=1 Tax=Nocardiopsis alba TaxID=53437 RepID=UPI0033A178E5
MNLAVLSGGVVLGLGASFLVSWMGDDPEGGDRVATFGEYVAPPGRDVDDSVSRTVLRTEAFGGAAVSRVHEFVLIVVGRHEGMSEGNIPRIECGSGSDGFVVFDPVENRGEYPSGLEGNRTLALTLRFSCDFQEEVPDSEVEVKLIEREREVVFRDPLHGVDRLKWEHEIPA